MMEALKCQLEGNSGRKFNRVARISGYFWLQQESSTGLPESVGISCRKFNRLPESAGISGRKFNRVARVSGYFWQKVQQGCTSQWVFLAIDRKFNRVARVSGCIYLNPESSKGLPESESISDFSQKVQQGCQRQWVFLTLARKFNSVVDRINICLTESFYFQ